jgi:RimJ/RimL family protein N-acetyltransferase
MDRKHATQIAALLNARNNLAIAYSTDSIMNRSGNFIYELKDGDVVAGIEVKKVQWYQWEVQHLTVAEQHERRGYGKLMLRRAEDRAKREGAKVLQCTIRIGNHASEHVFESEGYRRTVSFHNVQSGNDVAVWQKSVSTHP